MPEPRPSRLPRNTKHRDHDTRGRRQGPVPDLMSPSDLGKLLKPLLFLDDSEAAVSLLNEAPSHLHGIGAVTVLTQGGMRFAEPLGAQSVMRDGGPNGRRGGGVWHGDEMKVGESEHRSRVSAMD